MMQVPLPENVTVEPETEQTPLLLGSVVKTTAKPEVAVALIMYCELLFPLLFPLPFPLLPFPLLLGGLDVNVIVCDRRETMKDCCTWAAAW